VGRGIGVHLNEPSWRREWGGVGTCGEDVAGHQPLAHAADDVFFYDSVLLRKEEMGVG
jgi:hypothetical protein